MEDSNFRTMMYDIKTLASHANRLHNDIQDLHCVVSTAKYRYETSYPNCDWKKASCTEIEKFKYKAKVDFQILNSYLVSLNLGSLDIDIDDLCRQWYDNQMSAEEFNNMLK